MPASPVLTIIAPNFKRRLSGVTSTIIQLVPVQRSLGYQIVTLGPGLPKSLPHIGFLRFFGLVLRRRRAQVLVFHARRNLEMLFALAVKLVLLSHMKIVFTSASQRRHTGWTRFLVSKMDHVIATSAKTAAFLSVPNTVIMHGIDSNRFSPPADRAVAKSTLRLDPAQFYIGCVGRVRHQKGTDLFVDAMIRVLPERPRWSALVIGRATAEHAGFQRELEARVAAAGLSDRILFVGEHTNIPDWYRALDLQVNPQRWEGFGLTPIEGMASEVPVVATDAGAFAEQLACPEGEVGLLVPLNDLASMAKAAASLMDDDERRILAGKRGRAHVLSRFQIVREAEEIGKVYRAVAGMDSE